MRRAFAGCLAFTALVVFVVIRFGFKHPSRDAPAPSIADAGIADAPRDAADVVPDAAPLPKKPTPKRTATKIVPKAKPVAAKPAVPAPVIPTPAPPVPPAPVGRQCIQRRNPAGCPATEPNINRPCDAEGVQCVYGTSCCPPMYVCTDGAFEAWLTHCP